MKSIIGIIAVFLLLINTKMNGQTFDCSICDDLTYNQAETDSIITANQGARNSFDRIIAQNDSTKGLILFVSEPENGFSKCYILIPLDDKTNRSACQALCVTNSGPNDLKIPIGMIVPISKKE